MATKLVFQGTDGPDHFVGGPERDFATGNGGNDYLSGDGGRDALAGGDGHDVLIGGGGADSVYGNAGNDVVIGNFGDDALRGDDPFGPGGNDYLDAGAGNDYVEASLGHDTIRLGSGHDTLSATLLDFGDPDAVRGVGRTEVLDFHPGEDTMLVGLTGPDRVEHGLRDLDTNGDGLIDLGDADTFAARGGGLGIDLGHALDRLGGTSGHGGEDVILHGVHELPLDGGPTIA